MFSHLAPAFGYLISENDGHAVRSNVWSGLPHVQRDLAHGATCLAERVRPSNIPEREFSTDDGSDPTCVDETREIGKDAGIRVNEYKRAA